MFKLELQLFAASLKLVFLGSWWIQFNLKPENVGGWIESLSDFLSGAGTERKHC